jgi:drug/metabolite transporter (DMT)-like permease
MITISQHLGESSMKILFYVVGGLLVLTLGVFLIARGPTSESNPLVMVALVTIFAIAPLGAFWMMYMAVRHEKNPLPMLLLALIPFTFLWYYFECVRHHAGSLRSPK